MVKGFKMDIKALRKDFRNKGSYKTKITNGKITIIDSNSVAKLESHINTVTDTLFLELSRGMRMPAMYTGSLYYDATSDSWEVLNNLNQGANFYKSVSISKSGDAIQTLTLTVDSDIMSLSDSTPLFFVYNTSTVADYANDYVLFPRISQIEGVTIDIAMESNNAGTWGYYESTNNGEEGLSLGIDCLLQTTGESGDTNYYTPGVPDWTYSHYASDVNYIHINGYVFNTIIETSEEIDWECIVKGRAIEWVGDCSTGAAATGETYFYVQEADYRTGLHVIRYINLKSNTQYKMWVQIDSKVGQDNLEWQLVGCFFTDSVGDPPPDIEL
jgi:hypothetical protein